MPSLQSNTGQASVTYSQAFPTGTSFTVEFNNNRQTTNSPFFNLSPVLNSMYRFSFQQQLLAGFGFGPNLRFLTIAKNNKKISDIAFKDQVTATITQIKNIYWDLVNAYEQARVNEQSLAFAQQSLDNARKQLQLDSVPAMDVMRAEAEVSKRDQDLTVARTSLQLQELLIKNALTKSLDDPVLEAVPVVPVDHFEPVETQSTGAVQDLIAQALRERPELAESDVDLVNRQISGKAARNALLPSLALVGFYGGVGTRRAAESDLQPSHPEYFQRADRFLGSALECIQQFLSRLLHWAEPQYPDTQSRGESRSVPLRAGIPAGRTPPRATEKADSD